MINTILLLINTSFRLYSVPAGYSNVGSKQNIMTVYLNIQLENATDATICDKCYFEGFLGGYCPREHIKKSAHADICVKSYWFLEGKIGHNIAGR